MIPRKFCKPAVSRAALRGLKQTGKTRCDGTRFERRYRCQDCGTTCVMRGDTTPTPDGKPLFDDEWIRAPGS